MKSLVAAITLVASASLASAEVCQRSAHYCSSTLIEMGYTEKDLQYNVDRGTKRFALDHVLFKCGQNRVVDSPVAEDLCKNGVCVNDGDGNAHCPEASVVIDVHVQVEPHGAPVAHLDLDDGNALVQQELKH